MKTILMPLKWNGLKFILIFLSLAYMSLSVFDARSAASKRIGSKATRLDTTINSQLNSISSKLQYPKQVARFYAENHNQIAWVKQDSVKSDVWMSMLLMDCVLQFGLNRNDFHPDVLTYDALRPLTKPGASLREQQIFDIYLTDALLTVINQLHYGKFNPVLTKAVLESDTSLAFNSVRHLINALGHQNFMTFIVSAQPQNNAYRLLQDYLHLIKGQYIDDCYTFPEGDARKIAINLERMRWVNTNDSYFIQINIPSYTLRVINGEEMSSYKTIVGKVATPTPEIESQINLMTTAPDWKVPHKIFVAELLPKALKDPNFFSNNHYALYDRHGNSIQSSKSNLALVMASPNAYDVRQSSGCDNALGRVVFRFPNKFDIYLHDTPEQKLFTRENRAFSHGCVRVEHADELAKLLLINDGANNQLLKLHSAIAKFDKKDFKLKKPIPIKITYLTCEMDNGIFKVYPDVYARDKTLEDLMFPRLDQYVKSTP